MAGNSPVSGRSVTPTGQRDVDRENKALRELVTVYRHLSGLALQDTDLDSVTRVLSERIAATVAVVSQTMDVLAAAAPGLSAQQAHAAMRDRVIHPHLGQVLRASRQSHRALRLPEVAEAPALIVAPVVVGDEVAAHLITLDPTEKQFDEDMSLLVTEHAATICGIVLGKERVVAAAASRARVDLIEGLLLGRGHEDGEARRWAAHLGYDETTPHHVVIVDFAGSAPTSAVEGTDTLRQRLRDSVEHFVATRAPEAITAARETEVVVVTPGSEGKTGLPHTDPRELANACLHRLDELFPQASVVIGIGESCRAPEEVARSYAQAQRTVASLRRLGRGATIAAFEDLGIHRVLLQVPDIGELRGFAHDVLGPLSVHEREHRSEYLRTLNRYLECNNSPQRASKQLHVHPNTVAYRVKRIEELTGLRLDDYRDRLMAGVALEIFNALGDEP